MRTDGKILLSSKRRFIRFAGCTAAGVMLLTVVAVANPDDGAARSIRRDHQSKAPAKTSAESIELLHELPLTLARPAEPRRRTVRMVVTAYCPCSKCCGPTACGITASGSSVTFNDGHFVAADATLQFGTNLIIPGYNPTPVQVLDRGSAIRGNHIDVFFPTHQQALDWGRQTLDVVILD